MAQAPVTVSRRQVIEAVVASTIGTTIEWYDFFLYGTAAALVFPRLFFPQADAFTGQILAFSTFTVGFLARPLGGVVFGYMGDRIGRKSALVSTLLLMGFSTLFIGFLPTYDEIGLAAPVLLTALRFLQGLGVGGEWGGAVLLALEYGHKGRRGFYASWPQAGVPLGLLASTGVMAIYQGALDADQFLAWGWRVPFYLSGILIAVGLLIRIRIMETPLFAALQKENKVAEAPVRETLRHHWREILLIAGTRVAENAVFYLFTASAIAYGRDVLHVESGVLLLAVNVAAAVEFFTIPLFGLLSDRWSRRGAYMAGCWSLILFALPFYYLMNTRETGWIVVAVVVGLGGVHALLYSVQAALIPELFSTRLRCTGASIGYQLAVPLAGGLAPLIAAVLIREFPGQYWPLAAYIVLISAISLFCVQRLAETSRKELH
ncbi:MAG: MHS family MFS transporter [Gemmataceae bacterium]|nr:MHS family MFS transporter [Gemmataceae bacterium]MCI0742927.1 MHS family MFS transporter [Gemmataceae bacterium]